ncbi:KH domain-containing protein [Methanosalsum natronophilum]|uniref:RNA-processing protein n=1 Tax=Methanosalsum natronophilum TaxID=768733 RepID=A0A424YYB6_9EURY|nr:KH domain-containing protein [Methanosalsum natronophilum]MCS3924197.1 ribosomal RNA assembly protein [Methanosalsum natronophilum]RQD85798.1 MAG: RNA-processing protein [Methanosalsum natronophilum]
MTHIKIPQDRIGVLIGPDGNTKKTIEEMSESELRVDSESGMIEIIPGEDPVKSMRAADVVHAIARGFNPEKVFEMFDDEMMIFDFIDISQNTGSQKEMKRLKGRIIGKDGKARITIENLTGVKVSVYGKTVSMIGYPEQIQIARAAFEMLIKGVDHGSVFSFLDKKRPEIQHLEAGFR